MSLRPGHDNLEQIAMPVILRDYQKIGIDRLRTMAERQ
jgi:hypothetical protein